MNEGNYNGLLEKDIGGGVEAIDLSDWQWEDRGGHGLISLLLSQWCDWRRHPLPDPA